MVANDFSLPTIQRSPQVVVVPEGFKQLREIIGMNSTNKTKVEFTNSTAKVSTAAVVVVPAVPDAFTATSG